MYGYDLSAQTKREYPDTAAGIVSRVIREVQGSSIGKTLKDLFNTKSEYYAPGGKSDFAKWIAQHYGYRFGQDWTHIEYNKYFSLWQTNPNLLRALFKTQGHKYH